MVLQKQKGSSAQFSRELCSDGDDVRLWVHGQTRLLPLSVFCGEQMVEADPHIAMTLASHPPPCLLPPFLVHKRSHSASNPAGFHSNWMRALALNNVQWSAKGKRRRSRVVLSASRPSLKLRPQKLSCGITSRGGRWQRKKKKLFKSSDEEKRKLMIGFV